MNEGYAAPELESHNNPDEKKEGETSRERFDRIYDNPDVVTVPTGETFKLHDVSPEHPSGEASIFFNAGWLEDPVNGKETLERWYEAGRRVLWLDSPHGVDTKNIVNYISFDVLKEQGIPEELLSDMPMTELKKAAAILSALDAKGIDQTDAVGHSEGGINICIAALLAPERFRNIVLVDSGGLMGNDYGVALGVRSGIDTQKMFKKEKEQPSEYFFKDDKERGKMYFQETPVDTLEEAYGISQVDLRKILELLKLKGVPVRIVHGDKDLFFPADRMQKKLEEKHHTGIHIVEGSSHQGFVTEPTRFASIINDELKVSEAERKKNENDVQNS